MHLFLGTPDTAALLLAELGRALPAARLETHPPSIVLAHDLPPSGPALPPIVFSRQFLPMAVPLTAASIRLWADAIVTRCIETLPEGNPWRLHLFPHYGTAAAGRHRSELIGEAVRERLRQRHRRTLRTLEEGTAALTPQHSVVQVLLTSPETGFVSVAAAPFPAHHAHLLSSYPEGDIPVASDKAAPSRAFAKLLEAELRLGHAIAAGDRCVDLGACPGSWSYSALRRGASVVAVDRSPLRDDLMRHPRLTFHQGDAFRFTPETPVDWLICDVIAAPQRSIELLQRWLELRLCRAFVVTIKFKGTDEYPLLDGLRDLLPQRCSAYVLTRLCANRNEACAAGILAT